MRIRFLAALLTAAMVFTSATQAAPAKDQHVIVITVDGFPHWIWEDSKLPMPTLRKLAAEGISAPMKVSNPSVTWINHATLATGVEPAKHHTMYNGLLTFPANAQPPKIEQWRDKGEIVRVPTVYDVSDHWVLRSLEADVWLDWWNRSRGSLASRIQRRLWTALGVRTRALSFARTELDRAGGERPRSGA